MNLRKRNVTLNYTDSSFDLTLSISKTSYENTYDNEENTTDGCKVEDTTYGDDKENTTYESKVEESSYCDDKEDIIYGSDDNEENTTYDSKVEDSTYADDKENTTYSSNLEDTSNDDEVEDTSYFNELLQKLEDVQLIYSEKKVENFVLKRSIEFKNVSEFMNNLFNNKDLDDSISADQKRILEELYARNRELCARLKIVSKENRDRTKEVFKLYIRARELMEERKKLWNDAVKVYKLHIGDASVLLNLDESVMNDTNVKQKQKEHLIRVLDEEVYRKPFYIIRVAKIFYNLIFHSQVPWHKDKKLMKILECISKMLNMHFDLRHPKEFKKIIDEVSYKLSKVRI